MSATTELQRPTRRTQSSRNKHLPGRAQRAYRPSTWLRLGRGIGPTGLLVGLLLAVTTLGLSAGIASASDGVLEINQTCAVQTGCFPGDAAGFPVTITEADHRSFRLTSDLVVPLPSDNGIILGISSATLDLGGFEIVSAACKDATTNCTPSTTAFGHAVNHFTNLAFGSIVKNGSVVGMGYGVSLPAESTVQNIRARWNRQTGIRVGAGSRVTQSTSFQNGLVGILAEDGSIVTGNTTSENGSDGIIGLGRSLIEGNVSRGNAGIGIRCSSQSQGCSIRHNESSENASHGIQVETDSLVISNSVHENGGSGVIVEGSDNRIESNTATGNNRAFQVTQGGNFIVKNSASGSSDGNYVIATGNSHGPLISVEGVGNIDAVAGADSPWANFGF